MLGHVAVFVDNLEISEQFYQDVLGLKTVWKKENDKAYLTSNGMDILGILERKNTASDVVHIDLDDIEANKRTTLNFFHYGYNFISKSEFFSSIEKVKQNKVRITKPKISRDGTISAYFCDPDGHVIQYTLMSDEYLKYM